jgi:replicative DNA helicase
MLDAAPGPSFRRPGPPPIPVGRLFDREPPQSPEAEMSLLGCMILDPQVIGDVLMQVKSPGDFYAEKHGHIYTALLDLYDRTQSCDLVQLKTLLHDKGVLDQVGGTKYLVELASCVPSPVNWPHYAKIVADKAKLRRLISAAGQILHDAYHVGDLGPEGAREVLDKAETSVFDIAQEESSSDPTKLADLLEMEMKRIEADDFGEGAFTGVRTGYGDLDGMLQGLQPGELIIIAARPSMGKTALALNLAEQIATGSQPVPGAPATRNVPIAIFSLEMSKSSLVQRLLSAKSGVSSQTLRGANRISNDELERLMIAADDLKKAPIYIDDTPSLTVLQLRARARRLVAQYSVKAIMIDYLQLMTAPGAARESRQVEVSAISRGVKALARELNVPVVCLSQLNRASETREGNRPRMSDLRESGSIEQDADVIILLHREDYYHVQDEEWMNDPENADKIGTAELIIAKQRNGPTGVVKLKWDSSTTRFKNFDPHAIPPMGFVESKPATRGSFGTSSAGATSFASPGYSTPSQAAYTFPSSVPAPRATTDGGEEPPFNTGPSRGSSFGGRPKSGPIDGHRDGGGPDHDEELGDIPV